MRALKPTARDSLLLAKVPECGSLGHRRSGYLRGLTSHPKIAIFRLPALGTVNTRPIAVLADRIFRQVLVGLGTM